MKTFGLEKLFTRTTVIALIIGGTLLCMVLYVNYQMDLVVAQVTADNEKMLNTKIKELGELFLGTLSEEQKKNADLNDKLDDITDTVEDLEKLSETDKELLKKYSKVYFLNEHYVPSSLSTIDSDYVNASATNFQIHRNVREYLEDLLKEAEDDGMSLKVQSAYRSFSTQTTLKANYKITYGSGANQFSADQGYSEHQLGTTVDFTTANTSGALEGFDKTPEYQWLLDNAHKYGFILSYPAGNAYYKFEPWHWRFVGVSLAKRLDREGINFYDMDQRIIDGYLLKIFD